MQGTHLSICPGIFVADPQPGAQTQIIELELNNSRSNSFHGIVSQSSEMHRIFKLLERVSRTDATVLVTGSSGTGKELIAKAIHRLSGRTGKMVPVNCGAIPEELLESELFGHEKGAFTGAISSKIGRFQLADNGTIFLDEIAEMSPKLQVKLLRVLQERKVEPVGSVRTLDVNVRVIAATNKDLAQEVKAGRFREDLFYRLQVVPIALPNLTERGGDVLTLARYFLDKMATQLSRPGLRLSPEVESRFLSYPWPGNVRELENLIERLAIVSENENIQISDLPEYLSSNSSAPTSHGQLSEMPDQGLDFNALVNEFEINLINLAMRKTNCNKKAAARLLNLNRTTLVEKIKKKNLVDYMETASEASAVEMSEQGSL